MIIHVSPKGGPPSGHLGAQAQPQALGASAGGIASRDGNVSLYPEDWHLAAQVVQGEVVVTPPAGFRDRLVAEAERLAFDAIQATAAEDSLTFWDNPEEDVYEDL
jgi:hypothetical protein